MSDTTRTHPAHHNVTAQAANALYHSTGVDWPTSGDMTTTSDPVPLGPEMAQHLNKTHSARSTAHLGVLWGSPTDWRALDAVSHESRRIVAAGRMSRPDSAQPDELTTRADDDYCMHLSSHFLSRDDENGTTTYGCDACDSIWTEDDAN